MPSSTPLCARSGTTGQIHQLQHRRIPGRASLFLQSSDIFGRVRPPCPPSPCPWSRQRPNIWLALDRVRLRATAPVSKAQPTAQSLPSSCQPFITCRQTWCLQADRYKRIASHIAQSTPEHPLSEEQQLEMAAASLNLPQICAHWRL